MRAFITHTIRNRQGFTLVEMLVAVLIGMIIMAAVTGVFIAHTRSYTVHDEMSAIQQNLRGLMMVMPAEIRMAGCTPLEPPKNRDRPEIISADATRFEFTADLGGKCRNIDSATGKCNDNDYPNEADGDLKDGGERVDYVFFEGSPECGRSHTPGVGTLCRRTQDSRGRMGKYQPLADNIEKMEFNYIVRDKKKFVTTTEPSPDQLGKISAVQISLLARAAFEDPQYKGPEYYYPASCEGEGDSCSTRFGKGQANAAFDDHYRRRLVITTVQLRNI